MLLQSGLLMAALVEGVWGVLQFTGVSRSGHNLFPFTGSFYNPGPFACYLALTVPLALHTLLRSCGGVARWLSAIVLMVDALLLPASMSRTAWVAASVGSVITLLPSLKNWIRRHGGTRLWIPVGGMLLVTCATGAYRMKMASADGRLLMWKVALTAVDVNPFKGVGWDWVAGEYGNAQERYFAQGEATEHEVMAADAPEYVFNEYLQVAIAYGWGWAVLMTLFLFGGLWVSLRNGNRPIAGCLGAAMLVMTASYPFQFAVTVITICAILAAAYFSTTLLELRMMGVAGCVALCIACPGDGGREDVRRSFGVGHRLHQSGRWRESNDVLIPMSKRSSDPMPLNIIGKNYRELGMTDSAEYYLRRAVNRCPNRLYPHYLLMQLYGDSLVNDPVKTRKEALIILNMKEKVPSTAVEEMREEATDVISCPLPANTN